MALADDDLVHLSRCVELAREALLGGDEAHPEFAIARWSVAHAWVGLGRIVYAAQKRFRP